MGPSDEQWTKLLDFVEDDAEMRTGQYKDGPNGKARLADKWSAAADELNIIGPANKVGNQWKEAFYGMRARARQSYSDQVSYMTGTGGGVSPEVQDVVPNPFYARCLNLCGIVTAIGNTGVASSLQGSRMATQRVAALTNSSVNSTDFGFGVESRNFMNPSTDSHHHQQASASVRFDNTRESFDVRQFESLDVHKKMLHTPPHGKGLSPARKRLSYNASSGALSTTAELHSFQNLDIIGCKTPVAREDSTILENMQVIQVTLADILEDNRQLKSQIQALEASAKHNAALLKQLANLPEIVRQNNFAIEAIHELTASVSNVNEDVKVIPGLKVTGEDNSKCIQSLSDQVSGLVNALNNITVNNTEANSAGISNNLDLTGNNGQYVFMNATDNEGNAIPDTLIMVRHQE